MSPDSHLAQAIRRETGHEHGSQVGAALAVGDRCRCTLVGLASGDALGTTLEFESPGTFTPVTEMVGGGPLNLRAGEWTDGTSMALCLAESLLESGGFDFVDQLERYVRWWREGHLSSTGGFIDIGIQTEAVLPAVQRWPASLAHALSSEEKTIRHGRME